MFLTSLYFNIPLFYTTVIFIINIVNNKCCNLTFCRFTLKAIYPTRPTCFKILYM